MDGCLHTQAWPVKELLLQEEQTDTKPQATRRHTTDMERHLFSWARHRI